MILVPVVPAMGEDEIGVERISNWLERLLDPAPLGGKETLAEAADADRAGAGLGEKRFGAGARLAGAPRIGAEDHPMHLDAGLGPEHPQQRAAAADFNIIAVRSEAEHP